MNHSQTIHFRCINMPMPAGVEYQMKQYPVLMFVDGSMGSQPNTRIILIRLDALLCWSFINIRIYAIGLDWI